MGKRKPAIELSSSEDDIVRTHSTGRTRGLHKSSSRPSSAARKKTRDGRSKGGSDGWLCGEAEAVCLRPPSSMKVSRFPTFDAAFFRFCSSLERV